MYLCSTLLCFNHTSIEILQVTVVTNVFIHTVCSSLTSRCWVLVSTEINNFTICYGLLNDPVFSSNHIQLDLEVCMHVNL